MSPHARHGWICTLITGLLAAAGCGSEAAPTDTPVTAAPPPNSNPLDSIPAEEIYGVSPAVNIRVPEYELEVPGLPAGWSGARFAIISDMQLGLWEGNEEVAAKAVATAIEMNPDVVLLLGDFLARGDDPSAVARVLAPLRGRRTLAVLGDRDIRTDSIEDRIRNTLRESGVQVLSNGSASLERGGDEILIAGLDPGIIAKGWGEQQFLVATAGEKGLTPILMTHSPAMVTRAPRNRYPIVVAGGTFCGQVEVSGSPRLSWLRQEALPGGRIEGLDKLFRVMGSTVLVTCGTGYGFVPLRYGAPPEVAMLTIVPLPGVAGIDSGEGALPDSILDRYRVGPADTSSAPRSPGSP